MAFKKHAYLAAPTAAVILSVMGTTLTVWPSATPAGKVLWFVGFVLVGLLAIIGVLVDRKVSERSQSERDEQLKDHHRSLHQETRELIAEPSRDIMIELRKISKSDASRLPAARESAAFLAQQIHDFLEQYPPPQFPQLPPEFTQIELADRPEILRFIQVSHRYEFQLRIEYRDKYQDQAMNVAIELARAGEVDAVLLVLIHNIHFSGMLKMLADRLQVLSEVKP